MSATRAHSTLTPLSKLFFRPTSDGLEALKTADRSIWLVGKKERLKRAAREISVTLNIPLLERMAEGLSPGYGGAKAETPWLDKGDMRKITLVALPEQAGRHVTPVRADAIAKQLHGKVAGTEVVLAVGAEDALAAGLAVARCLPPYSAKAEKPQDSSECHVTFIGSTPSEETLELLRLQSEGVRIAQGLVDRPPNVLDPASMASVVLEAVKDVPQVTTKVIEGEALKEAGYGLLYAVGKSAVQPARLVVLTHPGKGDGKKGVAIVGKGITFDTGGAALKSREGMIGMKRDMGGAAGVFGAFLALARAGGLKSGRPLHCVLCIAENGIGEKMFLQDDILTAYSGLTVEINNTDAEGRLVLADGVSHVAKNLDCELIVDMATLTGAQGISSGVQHALIIATDEDLEKAAVVAGKESGDLVLPGIFAPEILIHEFDSEFADMRNSVKNRGNAQSSCAGLFIHRHLTHSGYTGRWMHVDMAYPAMMGDHATGYGVGLLSTLLQHPASAL